MRLFGCYLLVSLNSKYKEHTYIGFTVDPRHRLKQHNGDIKGGAKKTVGKRPWQMVLVLYGFPNKTAALQFEWAWQHPHDSKKMRDIVASIGRVGHRYKVQAKINVLYAMLHVAPWNQFPLTLHWLTDRFHAYLVGARAPPPQIQVLVGGELPDVDHIEGTDDEEDDEDEEDDSTSASDSASEASDGERRVPARRRPIFSCHLCFHDATPAMLLCPHCESTAHPTCLAVKLLENHPDPTALLPQIAPCPFCDFELCWPDLIRDLHRRSVSTDQGKRKKRKVKM